VRYEWIDEYCLSKKGAKKDFKLEWGWDRYLVGGKMFGAICSHKDGRPIVTLKCEPLFGTMLRDNHEEIIPGYYMNKDNWNSVYLDGNVPDDVIRQMIDMSYKLVFDSLTGKAKREIIEGENDD
jgi:predicted DNA-binding protein (MmcQ/YjbR family)